MYKSMTPEYRAWRDMRQRCTNPHNKSFANYGGRGIAVCDRWDSFDAFLRDMGRRPNGCSLDRIDVDGDYTPQNCRWATPTTQSRNLRKHKSTSVGVRFNARNWCWEAWIAVAHKTVRIGSFKTKDEAIKGRRDAQARYWEKGEPLPTNGGKPKNNRSGYVGVYQDKRHGTWTAYYGGRGRRVHIGSFKSAEEAAASRAEWLRAHGIGEAK